MFRTDSGNGLMDEGEADATPIRFRVSYRSAEALVTEYTTCMSKGGCALVAKRRVAKGTRFVFEMHTPGQPEPLEVEGEVIRVRAIKATSNFEVGVEYKSAGPQREVVDSLLSKIGVDPNYELVRRYPRIPVNLVAQDRDAPVTYLIRDLSRSGMRIEGRSFADDLRLGTPIEFQVWLEAESPPVSIRGQVAWVQRGSRVVRTLVGVKFDRPSDLGAAVIGRLTRLYRPRRLELMIGDGTSPGMRVARRRSPLSPGEVSEAIRSTATKVLADLPNLQVAPVAVAPTSEDIAIQLGLFGDIEGALVLEISLSLARKIAAETLGQDSDAMDLSFSTGWDQPMTETWAALPGLEGPGTPAMDRSIAVDAVMEWATAFGGRICDRLEEQAIELELTAPVEGIPMPRLDDVVSVASFQGRFGGIAITVITREVSPNSWPV